MDKNLERLKLKIEYAKAQTEQLKLLVFIILTVGTGIISIVFLLYGKGEFLLKFLFIIGLTFIVPLSIKAYIIDRKLSKLSKSIEEDFKKW